MAKSSNAVAPILFIALFWNGIVGVFDGILGYQLYREVDARSRYESVEARILRSEVSVSHSDDGSTYKPDIQYEYRFGGMDYLSERHSFASFGTSDSSFANETCAAFPVGATVTAYVDPDEPSEAVLDVSGRSFPAAIVLFLAPFNCIGLGLIALLIGALRRPRGRSDEDETRGRYVQVDTGDHLVIRAPGVSPGLAFMISLCVTTFLAIFAVIPFAGFHAPVSLVFGALGACVAISGAIALRVLRSARSPEKFLHVDRLRGTYAFPADSPAGQLSDIDSIAVESEETNVTISGVRQHDHLFTAKTASGERPLFKVRGGNSEADQVLALLSAELVYRSSAPAAASSAA